MQVQRANDHHRGRRGFAGLDKISATSVASVSSVVCLLVLAFLGTSQVPVASAQQPTRVRVRDLGITIGTLPAGPLNAITDVAGVLV